MVRQIATLSALALLAAPVLAETGVGTMQVDNVSTMYGRASVPAVSVAGVVMTRHSNVNIAGRDSNSEGTGDTVGSAGDLVDQGYGRS